MRWSETLKIGVLLAALFCNLVLGQQDNGFGEGRSPFNWKVFFNIQDKQPSTPKSPHFKDHKVNYGHGDDLYDVKEFADDILGLEKDFLDERDA